MDWVASIRHEDGKLDLYDYSLVSNLWVETVTHLHEQSPAPVSGKTTRDITLINARGEILEQRTETHIDGIWYTIARNRMTYNEQGKRTSLENLAGQVTTTAWDGWSVTYNGENRPVLWECVSPNSPTPTLISMSYDRMGRRVTKNDLRFVYDGYLQIANFEHQTSNVNDASGDGKGQKIVPRKSKPSLQGR